MEKKKMGRLVLTRNIGTSLKIGDDVYITITHANKGQAKLFIEAPRDMIVMRTELLGNLEGDVA
jgi:carbon storage regulator CsrA